MALANHENLILGVKHYLSVNTRRACNSVKFLLSFQKQSNLPLAYNEQHNLDWLSALHKFSVLILKPLFSMFKGFFEHI